MPRKSRVNSPGAPGALHHVIIRGIDRGKIFQDPADKHNFLDRLAEILKATETRCYAWALIPAKSLLCYWANRELGLSMAILSRRMNVSVMAISYAVQRGEKIAKDFKFSTSLKILKL